MRPNTPEWYAARKGGIGASDAPIIMGHSPWKTISALYKEKQTPYVEGTETSNFAMEHGRAMEPEAYEAFIEMTGFTMAYDTDAMFQWNQELKFDGKLWQFATFDGLIYDDPFIQDTFVEIKCPLREKTHLQARNGEIPEHYYTQMQHQMSVHPQKPPFAYYFSYFQTEGIILKIDRDEEAIKKIIDAELAFMECLKSCTPPVRRKNNRKTAPIIDA